MGDNCEVKRRDLVDHLFVSLSEKGAHMNAKYLEVNQNRGDCSPIDTRGIGERIVSYVYSPDAAPAVVLPPRPFVELM